MDEVNQVTLYADDVSAIERLRVLDYTLSWLLLDSMSAYPPYPIHPTAMSDSEDDFMYVLHPPQTPAHPLLGPTNTSSQPKQPPTNPPRPTPSAAPPPPSRPRHGIVNHR